MTNLTYIFTLHTNIALIYTMINTILMQNNLLQQSLAQIGLHPMEVAIYMYLLYAVDKSVQSISNGIGLSRVATYKYLDLLNEKGLIEHKKDFNTPIILTKPTRIISMLREKEHQNSRLANDLSSILPDLISHYYEKSTKKFLRHLEGQSQLIYLLDEMLDEAVQGEEFLSINEGEDFNKLVNTSYLQSWIVRRVKKQVSIRTIIQSNNRLMQEKMEQNKFELRETKVIPVGTINVPGCITIIKNKVIIWDTALYEAIVIDSRTTADLFRGIFESYWGLLGL
jgi:sugar-specific transcriptional regulator TrmB